MRRREFLSGAAAIGGGALVPSASMAGTQLRAVAGAKGIEIGSIYSHANTANENALLEKHCDVLVPENALKPSWLYAARDATASWFDRYACQDPNLQRTGDPVCVHTLQRMLRFAKAARPRLRLHGHAVYWAKHPVAPSDVKDEAAFQSAWQDHIGLLVDLMPDAMSWDVINEPFVKDWSRLKQHRNDRDQILEPDPYLGSNWARLVDHYAFCIRTLRAALDARGRSARLMLNEAELHAAAAGHRMKRALVPLLLDDLETRGAQLDGVGLQCHVKSDTGVDADATAVFISNLQKKGYAVHVSELDFWAVGATDPKAAETAQANIIGGFLEQVLQETGIKRLSFWGLSDPSHVYQRTGHPDGARISPAIFRGDGTEKPVFQRILRAISDAPRR